MTTTSFRHGLGDKMKDRISGLTGIVMSRAEHLFGCNRYWLQPQDVKDGKPHEGAWFDEDAVELIETGTIEARQYRVVDARDFDREAAAVADRYSSAPSRPALARSGGPSDQPSSQTRQVTK